MKTNYVPIRLVDGKGIIARKYVPFFKGQRIQELLNPDLTWSSLERYSQGRTHCFMDYGQSMTFPLPNGVHVFPKNMSSHRLVLDPTQLEQNGLRELERIIEMHELGLDVPEPIGFVEYYCDKRDQNVFLLLTMCVGWSTLLNLLSGYKHFDENYWQRLPELQKRVNAAHLKVNKSYERRQIICNEFRQDSNSNNPESNMWLNYIHGKKVPGEVRRSFEDVNSLEHEESDAIYELNLFKQNHNILINKEILIQIFAKIRTELKKFADAGYILNDLSPRNVVITPKLHPIFVDFEKTQRLERSLTTFERIRMYNIIKNEMRISCGFL